MTRKMRKSTLASFILFVFGMASNIQNINAKNLAVKDSTFNNGANNIPVYIVTWTDNIGNERTAWLTKPFATDNYPGMCVRFTYYDANNKLVTINSATPSAPGIHDRGFGATVHHLNDGAGGYITHGTNITFTLRNKGDHFAFFDLVQDVDGAKEYITYAFYDGLDYFQWQETVKCGPGAGTFVKDSRGPYLTMDWDGNGAFDVIDGQEYGAQKYLKQPSYTANGGAYTFNGTCDIPYVQEWKGTSEVGYVQSQTYTQQLAGSPDFSATNIPAVGTLADLNAKSWALDFQMNIFDKLQKMTWGMPYGYMDGKPAPGLTSTGTKAGYGQYSLSVVFDALAAGGVKRIIAENRIIQNTVTLTATLGSVVTTGPVGTANPTMQTLVPAGYDHNYRAWWLQGNTSDQAQVTMNVATGSLKNPTFRIKSFTQIPNVVMFNGNLLKANKDYYASYDATNTEAWVTLLKDVSGSNSILFQGNSSGITINSAKVTPASVSNNAIANLVFDVAATVGGTVKSVTLDLTAIGGGAAVAMTKGTTNYGFTYAMPAGITLGSKTVTVTVTDNVGNTNTATIPVIITSGIVISSATVSPTAIVNNVSNPLTFKVSATDDGSITSVTLNLSTIGGGTAVTMTKGATDYTLAYTAASGITEGEKAIVATVTDNQGNKTTKNITLTVNSAIISTPIYTDKATMINGTWGAPSIAQGGTIDANILEQSNLGAQEGVKDYVFSYSMAGYYAGFGLNVSNWGSSQKDFSTYDTLQIAYKGPFTTGTGITVLLTTAGGTVQSAQSTVFPASSTYKVVKMPMSAFTGIDLTKVEELDFVIKGPQTGAGTLNIDNIILIKKVVITNAISEAEQDMINSGLSVYPNPSNGTFTIASEMEGNYSILNSLGQTVQQVSLNSSNGYSRQIENLESGLYVIAGTKGSRKINQKLVVTK
jgi:hypothetical protein